MKELTKAKLMCPEMRRKLRKFGQLDPKRDAYVRSRVLLIDNGVWGMLRVTTEMERSKTRRDFILRLPGYGEYIKTKI